jgi:hypothetical protein
MSDADSPNKEVDRAIKKMLKDVEGQPLDIQVKVVNCAVNWEKCKNAIREKDEDFDPDQL